MTASAFKEILENAAWAMLLMLAGMTVWVILKRMSAAMRKGVIAAESALVDGLEVVVDQGRVEVSFNVPEGWQHDCHVHLLDASRTVLKQLHSGKLDEGRHSFTQEVIETPAVFLKFETTGQKLERRLQ